MVGMEDDLRGFQFLGGYGKPKDQYHGDIEHELERLQYHERYVKRLPVHWKT